MCAAQVPRGRLNHLREALGLFDDDALPRIPGTESQSQHVANTATRLARCATPSRGRYGQDGSVAAMQPLLQKQLKKSILFGATFPTVAPAFSAAADAMRKIAVAAPHLKTPHMVTAAGGATFNQKQLSPSLHAMTYPLADDKNSVTSFSAYSTEVRGDSWTHAFLDQHGEMCWQAKNTYAAMMDAQRQPGYVFNVLAAHTKSDNKDIYVHGSTLTSDVYDEQAIVAARLLLSGRFSDCTCTCTCTCTHMPHTTRPRPPEHRRRLHDQGCGLACPSPSYRVYSVCMRTHRPDRRARARQRCRAAGASNPDHKAGVAAMATQLRSLPKKGPDQAERERLLAQNRKTGPGRAV